MNVLRTPEERFGSLPNYPFAPHYVEIESADSNARVHYVDEGPQESQTVLLLHGEASWSFLYRRTIAALSAQRALFNVVFRERRGSRTASSSARGIFSRRTPRKSSRRSSWISRASYL